MSEFSSVQTNSSNTLQRNSTVITLRHRKSIFEKGTAFAGAVTLQRY